jgi:hypothetical protein
MKRYSIFWIILLFIALVLGPSLILDGPHRLTPGQDSMRIVIGPERLLDALNSGR